MLADLFFAGLFLTVGGILRVLGEGEFLLMISLLLRAAKRRKDNFSAV